MKGHRPRKLTDSETHPQSGERAEKVRSCFHNHRPKALALPAEPTTRICMTCDSTIPTSKDKEHVKNTCLKNVTHPISISKLERDSGKPRGKHTHHVAPRHVPAIFEHRPSSDAAADQHLLHAEPGACDCTLHATHD
jgi:hypothetical protein